MIEDTDSVVVTHWSEFYSAVVTQLMRTAIAKQHFEKCTEIQKSAYSIRPAELEDFKTMWPLIGGKARGESWA